MTGDLLPRIGGWLTYLPWLVLVPILAFFLLRDARLLCDLVLRVLPRGRLRSRGVLFLGELNETLAAYIRAQVTACLLIGIICTVGFVMIGVPYAVILGHLGRPARVHSLRRPADGRCRSRELRRVPLGRPGRRRRDVPRRAPSPAGLRRVPEDRRSRPSPASPRHRPRDPVRRGARGPRRNLPRDPGRRRSHGDLPALPRAPVGRIARRIGVELEPRASRDRRSIAPSVEDRSNQTMNHGGSRAVPCVQQCHAFSLRFCLSPRPRSAPPSRAAQRTRRRPVGGPPKRRAIVATDRRRRAPPNRRDGARGLRHAAFATGPDDRHLRP